MQDPEVVREFIAESRENLDRLDQQLVELERNPSAVALVQDIYRTVHTIKGTCGFLRFSKLEALAHAGENLLSRVRDGSLLLGPEAVGLLLSLVDAVRRMLVSIEASGGEGQELYGSLIERLIEFQTPRQVAVVTEDLRPEIGVSHEAAVPAHPAGVADRLVRVDVGVLDKLMNLVGELVLSRNQILQFASSQTDSAFAVAAQHLSAITSELQDGILKTRMQSMGTVFGRFHRVVRDLAQSCGKEVLLDLFGEDTELDRGVLEMIRDPLTHLLRNAVAHGIEFPRDRVAAGKPRAGRITVRASNQSGQVTVEVEDDGMGISPKRVKDKAIERGILAPEHAPTLTEEECIQFVFSPGFSTAPEVTEIAGRGIGLDIVKTEIEKVGGHVEVDTSSSGTRFRIVAPLTLTIVPALVVKCAGERYAIPQTNLLELVSQRRDVDPIEWIHGAPVYRLRGKLIPLLYSSEVLRVDAAPGARVDDETVNIVILQAEHRQFGLIVDDVVEFAEVVVRPVGSHLKHVRRYAGATILGDGMPALILDIGAMARAAHIEHVEPEAGSAAAIEPKTSAGDDHPALLLIADRYGGRQAIPLQNVARLEEIAKNAVESVGDGEVVHHRGEILPLLRLSTVLPERRQVPRGNPDRDVAMDEKLHVVVFGQGDQRAGIVVDNIIDITDEPISARRPASRQGVNCSVVLRDRVTEVLDVPALLRGA